jgi:hypothetical protein
MPLYDVRMTAALEGATAVRFGPGYALRVRFACGSCREVSDKTSVIAWEDEVDVPGGKGTAHLLQKCKNCAAVGNASIVSAREAGVYTAADAEGRAPKTVATLECRGALVPSAAEAGPGWVVVGPSGAQWPDVNLDDGEFAEYDEPADASITVMDIAMSVAPAGSGSGKR